MRVLTLAFSATALALLSPVPLKADDAICGTVSSHWLPDYLEGYGDTCTDALAQALLSGAPLCEWCDLYNRCTRTAVSFHVEPGSTVNCIEQTMPPPKYKVEVYLCGSDYSIVTCAGC
jgi:hypothetical protein